MAGDYLMVFVFTGRMHVRIIKEKANEGETMWQTEINFNYALEPRRHVLCIDCRSFYASVECAARGLNPLEAELVVMSYPSDDPNEEGSGLILASSPQAKKKYGINNVSRARDLPFPYPDSLVRVAPRMRVYMEKNREINAIYKQYADEENHHVYSVDESFLDVTDSLQLFNCQSPVELARIIQREVLEKTGIYTAVGIGSNPLLAKLALDNEAKHRTESIAWWQYEDVPEKIWAIDELTDFWGIGGRTARHLKRLGINTLNDLAHTNYYYLKSEFGMLGAQLYAHAWGIDRSFLGEKLKAKSRSIGNSQVLPRDYLAQAEVEVVVKEIAEQVATRLRRHHYKTTVVSLGIGFSIGFMEGDKSGFSQQQKVTSTNSSKEIAEAAVQLFRKNYRGQPIRHIGLNCGQLVRTDAVQLDIFTDPTEQLRQLKVDDIVDKIRQKYGFKSIIHATSLLPGARAVERSSLVGGHAGGMGGLDGGPAIAPNGDAQSGAKSTVKSGAHDHALNEGERHGR